MSGLTNVDNWLLVAAGGALFGTWLYVRSQVKRGQTNRGVVYKNMSTIEQSQRDKIREANRLLNQIDTLNTNLKAIAAESVYYVSLNGKADMGAYYYYSSSAFSGCYVKGAAIRRGIQEELVELEAQLSKLELNLS